MPSSELLAPPEVVSDLTIVNDTSHTIHYLYISRAGGASLVNRVDVTIRPGQRHTIALEHDT
jgi:hypothetical protein